jgi:chemotaxis protein histidine kinase CheA
MKNTNAEILRSLRAARRRLRANLFLDRLATFVLFAGMALVVIAAARRWLLHANPLPIQWAAYAAGAAVLFALMAAIARRIDLHAVAECVDRLGETRDRFLSALTFSKAETDFQELARNECRTFLRRKKLERLVRLRLPGVVLWLAVPAIAILLMQWEWQLAADARRAAAEAAQRETEPTANRLEQLAKEIEKTNDPEREAELKKLAEQLRKSAERLRAQDNGAEEAAKAALRELSSLEQMLAQMQKPPASASPEEMKELAKALEKNDATKDAAQAMKEGKLAEAGNKLEDAAKQELTKQEAEKALKDALDRLASQRALSEALQQLAKQLQQSGGGQSSDALQKLAQMLKQMGSTEGGKGGKPMTEQMLKDLLAAIEGMKFGENKNPSGNPQAPGDGDGKITIQAFGKPDGGAPDSPSQIPAGRPGSERDLGTTETPFGKTAAERRDEGDESAAKGRLGEGESLSQLLPTAGDTSKPQRRYKELYEAMAPAAEEAVVQENIPLGSRFFIKRYFESIRPN